MSADEATPIRPRRPTAEETDLALVRAALREQGQTIAGIHAMLVLIREELADIKNRLL